MYWVVILIAHHTLGMTNHLSVYISCITLFGRIKKSKQRSQNGLKNKDLVITLKEIKIKGGIYGQQVIVPPYKIVSI